MAIMPKIKRKFSCKLLLRGLTFVFLANLFILASLHTVIAAESYDDVYAHNKSIHDVLSADKWLLDFYSIPRAGEREREITELANSIVRGISDDYDKVRAIHDWVADNIWYDRDVRYKATERGKSQLPVNVIKDKRAVCEGYTNLSVALLKAVNIPARYVRGTALKSGGDHAWTEAFAGNRWIIFDATYDSANKYEGGAFSEKMSCKQTYFDMSVQEMSKTHKYDDRHSDIWFSNSFYMDTMLTDITLPEGMTNISNNAFVYCQNLVRIDIPDSVKKIGKCAFQDCPKLVSVKIPNGVPTIEDNTFMLCTGLESVDLPDTVTIIERFAFNYCESLKSITIPESTTVIGEYAFSLCKSLTDVVIPDSVVSIGAYAFSNCYGLTSVTVSNRVTRIEEETFLGCTNLISVIIPESITYIHDSAFLSTNKRLTIYGVPGSAAEAFAKKKGIMFAHMGAAGAVTATEMSAGLSDVITLTIGSPVVWRGGITMGVAPEVPPMLIDGYTMLPFRYLVENMLGGLVKWDENTRIITAWVKGHTFLITPRQSEIMVDGEAKNFGQAPVIVGGYTVVPVRAFEAAVTELRWNAETQQVTIVP